MSDNENIPLSQKPGLKKDKCDWEKNRNQPRKTLSVTKQYGRVDQAQRQT